MGELVISAVFSIVSHGQLSLVRSFLEDYRALGLHRFPIILTINIPEDESVLGEFLDLPITILRNSLPKGFGDNHNAAFEVFESRFFVVINPDIRLVELRMEVLLSLFGDESIGAVAPIVLDGSGVVQDSVRRFPTVSRLLSRALLGRRSADYVLEEAPVDIDWAAGMFLVFRSSSFRRVAGFDGRYFMYMEDADICRRLRQAGIRTVACPLVSVIHQAQRASRRELRHLRWHLASAFRFLFLPPR